MKDVYRSSPGYYRRCSRMDTGDWVAAKSQDLSPDARVGYPWTKSELASSMSANSAK